MFDNLKFRLQLMQLESNSSKLSKKYLQVDRQIKNKDQDDYLELQDILRQQIELQTWIEFVQTKYYQQKCNRYIIQMPKKEDGNYYKFNFDDGEGEREILTIQGFKVYEIQFDRRKKRSEKHSNFERINNWANWSSNWINFCY